MDEAEITRIATAALRDKFPDCYFGAVRGHGLLILSANFPLTEADRELVRGALLSAEARTRTSLGLIRFLP